MTTPAADASSGTNVTSASTTWNINVGSPVAGELLIVLVRFAADPGAVTFTGYTLLVSDSSDASNDTTAIYYRWADGAEGVSDVLSPTNSVKGCAICWEISAAENPATSAPTVSTVAVGTTVANTADPGSVAPAGAPKDTLYIAMMGADGEGNNATVEPSFFTGLVGANSGTTGTVATNCIISTAWRALVASSSEDPGVFTHPAAATGWTAFTVAVREATAAPPSTLVLEHGFVNFSDPGIL